MNKDTRTQVWDRLQRAALVLVAISVLCSAAFAQGNDQKAGSVLFYNLYTSSAANPIGDNTRINITNTNSFFIAFVHIFFVDGTTCSPADAFICLTRNQTASFMASDMDPGTSGYIVAIAVDGQTGLPIDFDFLIGDEFIKLQSGHAGNIGAVAVGVAIAPVIPYPLLGSGGAFVGIEFDGVDYEALPRVLAIDNFPSPADGNNTLVIINRIGGNLATGAGSIGNIFGVLYDDAEKAVSFSFTANTCQFKGSLSNGFPRTTPRLDTLISAGRSGWMRFWSTNTADQSQFPDGTATDSCAILGCVLTKNSSGSVNAFNGARNLHTLTLNPLTLLILPVFPPNC